MKTTETRQQEEWCTRPKSDRCGAIHITDKLMQHIAPDISIDYCDTQGRLRNRGVFKALHERLLLPESYIIHGIFSKDMGRIWTILVESPELPEVTEGLEYPMIEPRYCRTYNEDYSESTAHLVEIKVHQQHTIPITSGIDLAVKSQIEGVLKVYKQEHTA